VKGLNFDLLTKQKIWRLKTMKIYSFILAVAFSLNLFQNGCGNPKKANQPTDTNQNVTANSTSPSPSPMAPTDSPHQDTVNNGASEEEARPVIELMERCRHAPVAVGKVKATPITGTAPLKVTFDGSAAYDPDGTKIVEWQWYFGNRESAKGRKVTYIYEKPGKYGIGLNVTDSQGQKTSDCGTGATDIEITVTESEATNTRLQKGNQSN
jgi:PKD domain